MTLPCAFCDSPDGSKWHRTSCSVAREECRPEIDVLTWLRKVRERLTAHMRSIDYHTAMLCVENTEAEYRRLTSSEKP